MQSYSSFLFRILENDARIETCRVHDFTFGIEVNDLTRLVYSFVTTFCWREFERSILVLKSILEQNGDSDLDILKEVEYCVSYGLELSNRQVGISLEKSSVKMFERLREVVNNFAVKSFNLTNFQKQYKSVSYID